MSGASHNAPVIIKRKRVVAWGGHHGGQWKVAYADFVTAMMAFFLMLWLLGATTETQRRGLADYFSPSITIHRLAAGGQAMLSGEDLRSEDQASLTKRERARPTDEGTGPETESYEELLERLSGLGGESALMAEALRHVVTRVTDEGLVIELFDLPDSPLFETDTDIPRPMLRILARLLAEVLPLADGPLAIEGHVRGHSMVQAVDLRWELSLARAARLRELLENFGIPAARIARLTGHADRRPIVSNPLSVRNNRLEVIVLRANGRR